MGSEESKQIFKDVIVAVHGIGQQSRYSTVRSVATRLASSKTLLESIPALAYAPVALQPLGYFHGESDTVTSVSLLDDAMILGNAPLASTGFAEVFWADIPAEVVKKGSTLEETKAWAHTVVARAQALWIRSKNKGIIPPDFGLATEVLDEIIKTIYVLENLLFLADKAGLFKFDLRQVLEDYLCDVQLVAEFPNYRRKIVGRFHQAMTDIYAAESDKGNKEVRLHIVAHSEGTVISFLGLLLAMSGQQLKKQTSQNDSPEIEDTGSIPEWLKHIHGYMTIGSPIDKHILLWPRLWEKLKPERANGVLLPGQIRWRNYYDYGDPIGFKLDTARQWLDSKGSEAFQFCGCPEHSHDIGFARYLLPGKAHNDYWADPDVFEHFVDDVIRIPKKGNPAPRPSDKSIIPWLSPTLPYIFSSGLLILGVYFLYKAVVHFTYPNDPLANYLLTTVIGLEPTSGVRPWRLFLNTLGISGLIGGVTLFARFPRLAAGKAWKKAGTIAFGIGCVLYIAAVSEPSRREIGAVFERFFNSGSMFEPLSRHSSTIGVLSLAFGVGVLGRIATKPPKKVDEDRKKRWIWKGMRPLILCAALAVALIVGSRIFATELGLTGKLTEKELSDLTPSLTPSEISLIEAAGFDRKELDQLLRGRPENLKNLVSVKPFLVARPPVWPVLLATAGFLYLWWLATLIFDLAFVWQQYVRHSLANKRLQEWGPDKSNKLDNTEKCRNPARPTSEATWSG